MHNPDAPLAPFGQPGHRQFLVVPLLFFFSTLAELLQSTGLFGASGKIDNRLVFGTLADFVGPSCSLVMEDEEAPTDKLN